MRLSILLVLSSFVVMFIGWYFRGHTKLHAGMMASVMGFDLLFPVWLYQTHDWGKMLIDDGGITSFDVWAHLGMVVTLLVLYGLQIDLGRALVRGENGRRLEHRRQGVGIVWLRVVVFLSGMILISPLPS